MLGLAPFVGQVPTSSQLAAALDGRESDTTWVGASLVGLGLDVVSIVFEGCLLRSWS